MLLLAQLFQVSSGPPIAAPCWIFYQLVQPVPRAPVASVLIVCVRSPPGIRSRECCVFPKDFFSSLFLVFLSRKHVINRAWLHHKCIPLGFLKYLLFDGGLWSVGRPFLRKPDRSGPAAGENKVSSTFNQRSSPDGRRIFIVVASCKRGVEDEKLRRKYDTAGGWFMLEGNYFFVVVFFISR